jgi:hypothetical protein
LRISGQRSTRIKQAVTDHNLTLATVATVGKRNTTSRIVRNGGTALLERVEGKQHYRQQQQGKEKHIPFEETHI